MYLKFIQLIIAPRDRLKYEVFILNESIIIYFFTIHLYWPKIIFISDVIYFFQNIFIYVLYVKYDLVTENTRVDSVYESMK